MTVRHFGLSSRPAIDGGKCNSQGGSRGANAIQAPNVIRLPVSSLPANYRDSRPDLSLHDDDRDGAAICALAVVVGSLGGLIGACVYLGSLFFNLFDFG